MFKKININQKVKAYFHDGSIVSAELFEGDIAKDLPEGIKILEVESNWNYPTISDRQNIIKEIEIFDPIKLEISTNTINYKFAYISKFLHSWKISGEGMDECSGNALDVEKLHVNLVDIMYSGIFALNKEAEDKLGKV